MKEYIVKFGYAGNDWDAYNDVMVCVLVADHIAPFPYARSKTRRDGTQYYMASGTYTCQTASDDAVSIIKWFNAIPVADREVLSQNIGDLIDILPFEFTKAEEETYLQK